MVVGGWGLRMVCVCALCAYGVLQLDGEGSAAGLKARAAAVSAMRDDRACCGDVGGGMALSCGVG